MLFRSENQVILSDRQAHPAPSWHHAGIQKVLTLNPADFSIFGACASSPALNKSNDP
jgi:hypothetical protein